MHSAPSIPMTDSLTIRPWPDPVIDALGHDPRSQYVETFWLGTLGPSTTWLLRHVASSFERNPEGFDLPLADTARRLGLGDKGGRHSPFMRALARCVQFDLAQLTDDTTLSVRRKVPPLNRRQVIRLSEGLQDMHRRWVESQLRAPGVDQMRQRSRQLAVSLIELGEDVDAAERQLMHWKFHPTLCRESAEWAVERHRQARDLAGAVPEGSGDAA